MTWSKSRGDLVVSRHELAQSRHQLVEERPFRAVLRRSDFLGL